MKVYRNLCPQQKWNIKCPYSMNAEFIVVHNTANDANARAEIQYMISNNNYTSFHYAVDDKEIVQGIEENRNAYHAGDGVNGNGNRKGIAIEICYSRSGGERFNQAEELAAEFIAYKLNERGWGIDKVKKHQDFGRHKYCPHRTLDMGWERFLNKIRAHLGEQPVAPKPIPRPVEELYRVRITTPVLRIRELPNTNCNVTGKVFQNQVYTIVEEKGNWGKLKSGAGWICLDYTDRSSRIPSQNKYSTGRYVVNSRIGLNVRNSPGGVKIKAYTNGTVFDVFEVMGSWGRTPSGWVCLDYARRY